MHEENQPAHLHVADTNICAERCTVEYGNPCQYFCPASGLRAAVHQDRRRAGRGPAADQLHELRALQDLRHHGPLPDHHLGAAARRRRPRLHGNVSATADVAVVGAGLIGLGVAYELAKRGAAVTVYDRAEPARAASWAGAGMLAPFSEGIARRGAARAVPASRCARIRRSSRSCASAPASMRACGATGRCTSRSTTRALAELAAHAATFRANGGDVDDARPRRGARARADARRKDCAARLFVANEAQVDNRRLGRALVAACAVAGRALRARRRARARSATRGACAGCAPRRLRAPRRW